MQATAPSVDPSPSDPPTLIFKVPAARASHVSGIRLSTPKNVVVSLLPDLPEGDSISMQSKDKGGVYVWSFPCFLGKDSALLASRRGLWSDLTAGRAYAYASGNMSFHSKEQNTLPSFSLTKSTLSLLLDQLSLSRTMVSQPPLADVHPPQYSLCFFLSPGAVPLGDQIQR
ncbi:uncharacterized protein LOC108954331 isoform X2 [Eucalyptus grandis]|uniref:uncharacterized protein LOC108954331 isoform X2 n=1 Tax=Eucalyptus grandis TaxID=71139 RepID=UPI00192E7C48|nr:uncharacterized protein LOC108954331 isoform X2 [Eucalyptus grandis]XP_039156309.1 uncharacterized protein LOC108954331 isoform X2 [Eucalyptus grandis]XP_039156310.1 uncharacterized protein LOC108954331 isoform X2 [Eucalyptus grandis]